MRQLETVVALCVLIHGLHVEARRPTRPVKRHFLGGGKVAREFKESWMIDGRRDVTLRHTIGRVKVERTYKPYGRSNRTRVTQRTLVSPFPFRPNPDQLAALTFENALEAVSFGHLKTPSRGELHLAALRGMLERVGPYTRYVPPEEAGRRRQHSENNFAGVGVVFGIKVNKKTRDFSVRFDRVLRAGPAYAAGIRRGDKLIAVDGRPLKDALKDTDRVPGEAGSSVKLRIERAGKRRTFVVQRRHVDFNKVRTRLTPDGIGMIKLAEFDLHANHRVDQALKRLEARHRKENRGERLKGLVLDLRDDPGGFVFQAALPILNRFVGGRTTLMSQRGPTGNSEHRADPAQATHADLPLAVLVNRRTASASEIVAGALQDLGRATIIGERTRGKGWMQTELPLPNKGQLILTTDAFYLPSGRSIHNRGITPDISFDRARKQFTRPSGDRRTIIDYSFEAALSVLRGE
jgi:carboxyl-terminal processing protease